VTEPITRKVIDLPATAADLDYWSEAAENIRDDEIKLITQYTGLTQAQQNALKQIKAFIFRAVSASRSGESRILILRGEWGLGKTLLSKAIRDQIPSLSRDVGVRIIYKELTLGDLLRDVARSCRDAVDVEYCFSEALLEPAKRYISQQNAVVILFIDEFEWLIWHKSGVIGGKSILELMEAFMKLFRDKRSYIGRKYGGKVHIIFASTPSAYQIYLSSLKEKEFHGWLGRREDTADLYPAMKHEVIKIIDILVSKILRADPNDVFKDPRLKELIYTISQGNLGTAISVFNRIIYYSIMRCTEDNARSCIYQIDEILMIESLLGAAIATHLGKENPLDQVIFSQLLRNLTAGEQLDSALAMLFASSSLIFKKDYKGNDSELMNWSLKRYGVRLLKCRAYIVGNQNQLIKVIEDLANAIAGEHANVEYEKYTIKASLSNIIHLIDDTNYAISIPEAPGTLADLLSFYEPIDVNDRIYKEVQRILQESAYKVTEGLILAPEEYMKLYPVITPSIIPFIRNRADAKAAYIESKEEMNNNTVQFERDLEAAIEDMMITLNLVERDKTTRKLNIVVSEGRETVKTQLSIKAFVKHVVENAEKFKSMCTDTKLCILICPENIDIDLLDRVFRQWNRVIIPIKLRDVYYLVASIIARRKRYDVSHDELRKYYETLAVKYGINRIGRVWKAEGLRRGVIVPREINNLGLIPAKEKNPIIAFRDGYKTLLLGGNEFTLKSLIYRIAKIYQSTVYHGRDGKFCGVNVPSYVKVDLEPEGTSGRIPVEKLAARARSFLESVVRVACSNNMAVSSADLTHVKLTLHPIERRIVNVVSAACRNPGVRGVSLQTIKENFIFTTDVRSSNRVFQTFLDILEARGDIVVVGGKVMCIDINEYAERLSNEVENKWSELHNVESKLIGILEERGISPATIENALLHIAVAKEKGWKLILLKDLESITQEFDYDNSVKDASLRLRNLKFASETLDYVINVIKRDIIGATKGIVRVGEEIERTLESVGEVKESLRSICEENGFINAICDALKGRIESIEKSLEALAEEYNSTISRYSKFNDLLKLGVKLLGKKKDREALRRYFHYSDGCLGDEKLVTNFNLVYYDLFMNVYKELLNLQRNSVDYLAKIRDTIEGFVNSVKSALSFIGSSSNTVGQLGMLVSRSADILRRSTDVRSFYDELRGQLRLIIAEIENIRKRREELEKRGRLLKEIKDSVDGCRRDYALLASDIRNTVELLSRYLGLFSKEIPELKDHLSKLSELSGRISADTEFSEKAESVLREISASAKEVSNAKLEAILRYDVRNGLRGLYKERKEEFERLLRSIGRVIDNTVSELYNNITRLVNNLENSLPENVCAKLASQRFQLTEQKNIISSLTEGLSRTVLREDNVRRLQEALSKFFALARTIRDDIFRNLGLEKDAEAVFTALEKLTRGSRLRIRKISELVAKISVETSLPEERVLSLLYNLEKIGLISIRGEVLL